jgi:hypothetical protein
LLACVSTVPIAMQQASGTDLPGSAGLWAVRVRRPRANERAVRAWRACVRSFGGGRVVRGWAVRELSVRRDLWRAGRRRVSNIERAFD